MQQSSTPPQFYDKYSQQVYNFYQSKPETKLIKNPFVTMHSDYLNVEVKDDRLWAKSNFYEKNIIMQVRGKIVKESSLHQHLKSLGKNKYDGCFGILIWFDFKAKVLIKPIGISDILFNSSISNQKTIKGNCYIEHHYGSKLLIKAKDFIPKGSQIVVDEESIKQFMYNKQINNEQKH